MYNFNIIHYYPNINCDFDCKDCYLKKEKKTLDDNNIHIKEYNLDVHTITQDYAVYINQYDEPYLYKLLDRINRRITNGCTIIARIEKILTILNILDDKKNNIKFIFSGSNNPEHDYDKIKKVQMGLEDNLKENISIMYTIDLLNLDTDLIENAIKYKLSSVDLIFDIKKPININIDFENNQYGYVQLNREYFKDILKDLSDYGIIIDHCLYRTIVMPNSKIYGWKCGMFYKANYARANCAYPYSITDNYDVCAMRYGSDISIDDVFNKINYILKTAKKEI